MSSPPFKLNQGALIPTYQAVLVNGDGSVVNLLGATVTFMMTPVSSGATTISAPATIVSAANGQVIYEWQPGDTGDPGLYAARWVVTFGDGSVQTFPSDNVDLIEIVTGPNLGYTLQGACAPWTTIQEVRSCCSGLPASGTSGYISDDTVLSAINVATDLLYTLSGQQFPGECVTVLRPCKDNNCYGAVTIASTLNLSGFPTPPDRSALPYRSCGCGYLHEVELGLWPITNVVYVKVDGTVVNPATYRLDGNRRLVRLAGPGPSYDNDGWPTCQYLDRPATEPGTFEVMVEHGVQPPPAGRNAAAKLACELLKACAGQQCQLPGRVSSVTRQQVAFTMINPSMLDNGLTGLYEVDLFIMAYNPAKTRGQTVVWSPDLRMPGYRAGS